MRALALPIMIVCALAACSSGPSQSPAVADCEAQANNDPTVKQLISIQSGSLNLQANGQHELDDAKRQATLNCLRAKGLISAGGVEPVMRPAGSWPSFW